MRRSTVCPARLDYEAGASSAGGRSARRAGCSPRLTGRRSQHVLREGTPTTSPSDAVYVLPRPVLEGLEGRLQGAPLRREAVLDAHGGAVEHAPFDDALGLELLEPFAEEAVGQ